MYTVVTQGYKNSFLPIQLKDLVESEQRSRETVGLPLQGEQSGAFLIDSTDEERQVVKLLDEGCLSLGSNALAVENDRRNCICQDSCRLGELFARQSCFPDRFVNLLDQLKKSDQDKGSAE